MALSEFRDTYSWQGAIELGQYLAGLADDLPAAEQVGLAMQLRGGMVDLPSAVAVDLLAEGNTRQAVALRLVATLDLIDQVYPALDTGRARDTLEDLIERISGDGFTERKGGKPRPAGPAPEAVHIEDAAQPHHEDNPALKVAVVSEADRQSHEEHSVE